MHASAYVQYVLLLFRFSLQCALKDTGDDSRLARNYIFTFQFRIYSLHLEIIYNVFDAFWVIQVPLYA